MFGDLHKKYKNGSLSFMLILFTMGILLVLVAWSSADSKKNVTTKEKVKPGAKQEKVQVQKIINEDAEMLNDRYRYFFEGRRGPDGYIPVNARYNALKQEQENIKNGLLQPPPMAIPGNTWTAIGPAPLGNYSGRISAMAAVDANTIYAGGAQGGIWKTTNAGTTWTPLTDQKESLATGAMAVAPSNNNIIYVGTGEANHSCDSYFGAGVLKSTDAGVTWNLFGNSTFQGTSISKIIVHPTDPLTVWASTTRGTGGFICQRPVGTYGVYKTINGGTTWTNVLGNTSASWVLDMVIDPTDPLILYAGMYGVGVYKTTNGGTTWNLLAGGLPTTNLGVMALAIDPTNRLILYFSYEDSSSGSQGGLWKTTDGGTTWSSMTMPGGLCSTYCWYCQYVAVSPDGQYVFQGGVGLYRSNNSGCCSWSSVIGSAHVDQHAMVWAPGDTHIWIGNDGGVYQSTTLAGTSWTNKNTGIYVTQFYPGCSLHPTSATGALGGTQDNSNAQYIGNTAWTIRSSGDGAFTNYDQSNPNNTWYVSSQYLNIVKTTNNGGSFSSATSGLTDAGGTYAAFVAPYLVCPNNSTILIAGTDNVWRSTNSAGSWTSNSPDPLYTGNIIIRALAFAPSDTTCNTYFAGLKNGQVFRTIVGGGTTGWTNISTGLPLDTNQYRGVNDLAVHPTNGNIVYAAISGFGGPHLYKSINALGGSPTWSASDTGIPDIPVNAVLIDPTDTNYVYIGTDLGIYRSTDAGVTWGLFNNGHPRVAVYDLVANGTTSTIMSFTHGRAAFKLTTTAGGAGEASVLKITKSGTNLSLTWTAPGTPCSPTGYGLYRGTLPWTAYNHASVSCSITTTNTTTPQDAGSYYYLIVPKTSAVEGSYGKSSTGTERPIGTTPCVATQNTTC